MPVNEYLDPVSGKTMFKVRIKRRSDVVPGLAIDKRSQGFTSKAEADRAERKLVVQVERELVEAEGKSCTWEVLTGEWEVAAKAGDIFIREISVGTVMDYIEIIDDWTQEWMKLHVNEIDRAHAWRVLDKVEREVSVTRRKRLRTAIDAVFKWGILSGRLRDTKNIPTEGYLSTRKEEDRMPEILNLEQIRTFLSYAKQLNHPWYPIWAMALFTGMRSGELYALQWDCVDLVNQQIQVHRNWTNTTGLGPTKGRYWRLVPIESEQVLKLLQELKDTRGNEKFVLQHHRAWTRGMQAEQLREFCTGAGLPSIMFHTLRACFATQLIRENIAPAVVMKICGWKDLKTMQRYIRLSGIEVKGATKGLRLLPEREVMGLVVSLFNKE
jgi:integrase